MAYGLLTSPFECIDHRFQLQHECVDQRFESNGKKNIQSISPVNCSKQKPKCFQPVVLYQTGKSHSSDHYYHDDYKKSLKPVSDFSIQRLTSTHNQQPWFTNQNWIENQNDLGVHKQATIGASTRSPFDHGSSSDEFPSNFLMDHDSFQCKYCIKPHDIFGESMYKFWEVTKSKLYQQIKWLQSDDRDQLNEYPYLKLNTLFQTTTVRKMSENGLCLPIQSNNAINTNKYPFHQGTPLYSSSCPMQNKNGDSIHRVFVCSDKLYCYNENSSEVFEPKFQASPYQIPSPNLHFTDPIVNYSMFKGMMPTPRHLMECNDDESMNKQKIIELDIRGADRTSRKSAIVNKISPDVCNNRKGLHNPRIRGSWNKVAADGTKDKNSTARPFECQCGRTFARNEELTRHQRIHSGYKPHRCNICFKNFGRKDHLNKHLKTHLHSSQKKIHLCHVPNCGQSYTRSDALTRHQTNAHGLKTKPSKWRPHKTGL